MRACALLALVLAFFAAGVGSASGAVPGSASGAVPGSASGAVPGSASGVGPGSASGAVPGSASGAVPGSASGIGPGSASGISPGSASGAGVGAASGPDPQSCRRVTLSDIGWTDVTATTAITARLLTDLGYSTQIRLLSLPVTYLAMKSGQVDAFLGDWEPSGDSVIKPFLGPGGVQRLSTNLRGAKYTLAVTDEAYAAGLRDFADIARFAGPLHHKIYGLEPGNDGDTLVLGMLKANRFGLSHFILVESSEQGMLSQVSREVARHRPILFLAWAPHPMNLDFHLHYLNGGDAVFGPNQGGAVVNTIIRPGLAARCPNLARLLGRIHFDVDQENAMMAAILEAHTAPDRMAQSWLAGHAAIVAGWLDGVTNAVGQPATKG